jgi:pantoate--beta-alanine ligase
MADDERRRSVALPKALEQARDAIRGGATVATALRAAKQELVDAGFLKVDYLALVDAETLEPLEQPAGEMRVIAAATIGTTRLIDNIAV